MESVRVFALEILIVGTKLAFLMWGQVVKSDFSNSALLDFPVCVASLVVNDALAVCLENPWGLHLYAIRFHVLTSLRNHKGG
jgi:hypothetical protein